MTNIQLLQPAGLVHSPAFSHVAVIPPAATLILVGGQNSVDESGHLVGGDDAVAQTRRTLENVRTALASAGAGMEDLISWSMLIVDTVDLRASAAVAMEFLAAHRNPPLITAALVSKLGVPGALVEISAVAAKTPA